MDREGAGKWVGRGCLTRYLTRERSEPLINYTCHRSTTSITDQLFRSAGVFVLKLAIVNSSPYWLGKSGQGRGGKVGGEGVFNSISQE